MTQRSPPPSASPKPHATCSPCRAKTGVLPVGHSATVFSPAPPSAVWSDAGIECESSWRYHVIWWMCQNNLTTLGPVQGDAEPRLVLAAEWIRTPTHFEGDDALAEIAHRYTTARGPITTRDLAWWTGLTIKEARHALSLARERGSLTEVSIEGETKPTHWADPEQIEAALTERSPAATPVWHLLPAFDEHLLGYTDRGAQLSPEHAARIVLGGELRVSRDRHPRGSGRRHVEARGRRGGQGGQNLGFSIPRRAYRRRRARSATC